MTLIYVFGANIRKQRLQLIALIISVNDVFGASLAGVHSFIGHSDHTA